MGGIRLGGLIMLVTGLGLVVFGYTEPIARAGLWGAGIPIALAGVALFVAAARIGGQSAAALRKRGGIRGTALVTGVRDTGVTLNDVNAIFRCDAQITIPGRAPYPGSFKLTVGRTQWGAIQPGVTLPVVVDPGDPSRIAYDDGPAVPAPASNAAAPGGAPLPTLSARDIVVRGQHADATVLGAQLTGRTAGELSSSALAPDQADDPVAVVQLRVEPSSGTPFEATSAMRIPDGKQGLLAPGTRVPVAFLVENPSATTTIDWDRA